MESTDQFRTIRDFIYLNTPKLYSLYAQMFEGVAERILEENLDQKSTRDKSSLPILASEEKEGVRSVRRTSSVVLHDHMYSSLESELGYALQDANNISFDDIFRISSETPFIKVHGPAEIQDYDRLKVFTSQFNKMGEGIAYSAHSGQIQPLIDQIREAVKNAPNAKKKEAEAQIKILSDYKQRAREMGLYQDEQGLQNIQFFIELFSESNYNVVVSPLTSAGMRYRGVLEKSWLRVDPTILKSMYGGQSEFSWTMVGTVTYVPGTYTDWAKKLKELDLTSAFGEGKIGLDLPSILDALRNSFYALTNMERMFLESAIAHEVIMSPLAIYREFKMPLTEKLKAPVFGNVPVRQSNAKKLKDQAQMPELLKPE